MRELYGRHAGVTLGVLRRMTSDAAVAEDILQETWLAVWRSAKSFQAQSSVRSWIIGVARRQAHSKASTVSTSRRSRSLTPWQL
ncbi:MAG: RNA polymerase sigma factor [Solirubrobacteraceae bacterium]